MVKSRVVLNSPYKVAKRKTEDSPVEESHQVDTAFACLEMFCLNLHLRSSSKGGIDQIGVEAPRRTFPKQSGTAQVYGIS